MFGSLRRPFARITSVLVWSLILVGTQVHLESVRWWWSPSIVSALAMTEQQSSTIERLYEESLPIRQHASEDEMGFTNDIIKRIGDGLYDEELLHVNERLAGAQDKQSELRFQAFEGAMQVLTPNQRGKLRRLIAEKRIVE